MNLRQLLKGEFLTGFSLFVFTFDESLCFLFYWLRGYGNLPHPFLFVISLPQAHYSVKTYTIAMRGLIFNIHLNAKESKNRTGF